jgi:hypothetical protein
MKSPGNEFLKIDSHYSAMNFKHVVLLLILANLAFSACVGYQESFDIQVLDAKQRPIPNAAVNLTYDRGTSFGDKYFTIENKFTDDLGRVHYDLLNQGTTTRTIDCTIFIDASAGGTTLEKTIEAGKHGPVVDVILDNVYVIRFYVRDHLGVGLEGASVSIGTLLDSTNEKGLVKHYMKTGEYSYFADYLEATESGSLVVDDDVNYQVTFPYHSISIDVTDDNGEPLDAFVTMYNQTFQLENGHFENKRSFGQEINFEVNYNGLIKSELIIPDLEPFATVIYDLHAPLFGEIEPVICEDKATLVIETSDPGDFPSGVDVNSMMITYRMEPADPTTPWNSAVVFPTGFNTFTADFRDLPPDSVVGFKIEMKDKEGNRATIEGKFSTFAVEEIPENVTENQTEPQIEEEVPQEIPLFYIIGGVILVILTIYLGIRIKSMSSGGM